MPVWDAQLGALFAHIASVVSAHTGKTVNEDGPFPEAKGQIGGFGSSPRMISTRRWRGPRRHRQRASARSKYGH